MKSHLQDLRSRGYISENDIPRYSHYSLEALLTLLKIGEPYEQTVAAHLLRNHHEEKVTDILCKKLATEKKLYTKIELCETLKLRGKDAAKKLSMYLGMIDKNQYKTIPLKDFKKKSFPLPRDIAARTLAHMTVEVLPELIEILEGKNKIAIREVIDAIGFICFYQHSESPIPPLFNCYERFETDDLIRWKIIRAFQSFPYQKVIDLLEKIKNSDENMKIRREAENSLIRIKENANKKNKLPDKEEL